MKTIEERIDKLAEKFYTLRYEGESTAYVKTKSFMRSALTELAADMNAEKEKEKKGWIDAANEQARVSNGHALQILEQANILAEKEKDLAELRAWKESALTVMPDFQKLGKLLGLPLGSDVSEQLVPAVEKQTALLDEVKSVLAWYVGNQEPDWECTCEQCRNHAAAHSLLTRLGGSHE